MEFTVNQIAAILQGEVSGNGHEKINTIAIMLTPAKTRRLNPPALLKR